MTDAAALDARILAAIAAYALDDAAFLALARDIVAYQLRTNAPFAAFAAAQGITPERVPVRLQDLPAVPAAAFKEARLATFPPAETAVWFETSGTTQGRGGRHEMPGTRLYDAALLATFDRMVLSGRGRLRYLLLVPDPRVQPHSSLGHMMATIARERGDGADVWLLQGDALDADGFLAAAAQARADGAPVCLAATAFALVGLLDALRGRHTEMRLPRGSVVMETGGFKGRSRMVARETLYREAGAALGIPLDAIVAEYGMTELSSQYYDGVADRARIEPRVKRAPPWLRTLVMGAEGPVAPGIVGALRHIDLANRGSVIAIDTEDLGAEVDGGIVLLGREQGAELRGCSLDAETLRVHG